MTNSLTLVQATIFLAGAVVAVPLSKLAGLGAVLGYLLAGIVIGPWGLGLFDDVEGILHFAELGVVLLLFIIGLELQPQRLWVLRKSIFGLGGAQVLITALLLGLAAYLSGLTLATAVVVGLGLSLSSTAFALQVLAEKNQLTTRHGRAAFAILLFQDLAVIPLVALVPLLGAPTADVPGDGVLLAVGKVLGVLAAVIVGGRYILRYVLRLVAGSRAEEVFTALSLLTVIGAALLMELVGLSMALGAFLAGVLLADSEYRHALEADIEPFKGLLLGLFFMAVGMSVNVGLLVSQPFQILGLVLGLLLVKSLVLYGIVRVTGLSHGSAMNLACSISQGGEFAFVIFGVAVGAGVMGSELTQLLIIVVILSMGATPLLFVINDRLQARARERMEAEDYQVEVDESNQVIIAGFGRFGQIIARILRAKRIGFTALEINPEQVDFVRKFGNKIYFGDASRMDLLRAAKADKAVAFVLTIDDVEVSLRTAALVREEFPHLTVYARARNRRHVHQLMDLGVQVMRRETFLASVDIAYELLKGLGLAEYEASKTVERFKAHDRKILYDQYAHFNDEEKLTLLAKEAAKELEELFEKDVLEAGQGR